MYFYRWRQQQNGDVGDTRNISDLRSYIKSNMRFLTGNCGCALLTIIRIHGKGTVERMIGASPSVN